uniref:SEC23interacting proteinlike [Pundamilia nyererei] n=1 Tax=Lepeophtheirus salmonis TaxID=72036 RepID=A0A0K2T0W1_LEPSM
MNPLLARGSNYAPSLSETNIQFRAGVRDEASPPTLQVGVSNASPPPLMMNPAAPRVEDEVSSQTVGHGKEANLCHHWFYRTEKMLEGESFYWKPFDMVDSMNMESGFASEKESIAVMGGRYDVSLKDRLLHPVYWSYPQEGIPVMRASWFYQGPASHWIPFPEHVVPLLEENYNEGSWGAHRRISLGEKMGHVVFHSKDLMFYSPHCSFSQEVDNWGQTQETSTTPRIVHRGLEGLPDIPDGDMAEVDHLVFVVHGVGKYCDMKLRDLTEVVSSMREKVSYLSEKHFQSAHLAGSAHRVEFLPITWHQTLHGEDTGTDSRLKPLTLKSIPKLRSFMNDTLMDILFYTSPVFGQTIVDTVVNEINRVYQIFLKRNPSFKGETSVMGHSLGSVILFDILSHQKEEEKEPLVAEKKVESLESDPSKDKEQVDSLEDLFTKLKISSEYSDLFVSEGIDLTSLLTFSAEDLKEVALPEDAVEKILNYINGTSSEVKEVSTIEDYNKKTVMSDVQYVVGPAGTGQLSVNYPQLDFNPSAFYALGSPIALFLAIRGISSLGEDFSFPTCSDFFNIFHPYDPVAYRMEAMVNPQYSELRPITIPHHMGRKRMHLELKDTVTKLMTSDIRKKILEGVSYTLSSVYNMATGQSGTDEFERTVEDEVLRKEEISRREDECNPKTIRSGLNGGNRIDFVLQEAPLESFNEYLFAIASHICYWDSEDVGLMILKNVYSKLNIRCDEELNITTNEMSSFVDSNHTQPFGQSVHHHPSYSMPSQNISNYSMMPPLPKPGPAPVFPTTSDSYSSIMQPMSQIYNPPSAPNVLDPSQYSLANMNTNTPPVQPQMYNPSALGAASTQSQVISSPPSLTPSISSQAISCPPPPLMTPSTQSQLFQPPPISSQSQIISGPPPPLMAPSTLSQPPPISPSPQPTLFQPPSISPSPQPTLFQPPSITPSPQPTLFQPPSISPSPQPTLFQPPSISSSPRPTLFQPPSISPSPQPQLFQPSTMAPSPQPQMFTPPPITPSTQPQVYQPPPIAPPPCNPGVSMSLTRPSGYPKIYPVASSMSSPRIGMDPTAPLGNNTVPLGPPPMGGFVSKNN